MIMILLVDNHKSWEGAIEFFELNKLLIDSEIFGSTPTFNKDEKWTYLRGIYYISSVGDDIMILAFSGKISNWNTAFLHSDTSKDVGNTQ